MYVVIDERISSLKRAQGSSFLIALLSWTILASMGLTRDVRAADFLPYSPDSYVRSLTLATAIISTLAIPTTGVLRLLHHLFEDRRLEGAINGRGGEVNCHTLAVQYVRDYHSIRFHPFTREEESALVDYLAGRFGLMLDTAADIVAENWPLHRSGLRYKDACDDSAARA